MMNKFWWRNNQNADKGIHWYRWDTLCKHKQEGGLGFRKLHLFNKAMLAKQGWRLVSNPDSLLARIYKSRYHPQTSFLDACIGSSPSYSWRSILSTKDMLKTGMIRRIGTGTTTNIWHDPWLLDTENPFIESNIPPGLSNATIDTLMAENSNTWDLDILADLFSTRDQIQIQNVPLPRRICEDQWMWKYTKNGSYSVKSGYRKLATEELTVNTNSNNIYTINWQELWSLNVPPKIKHHLWRTLSGCLPTTHSLRSRHVDLPSLCFVCSQEDEDDYHAAVTCRSTRDVWRCSDLGDASMRFTRITDWWIAWNKEQKHMAAMILWAVWYKKNQLVWKQKKLSPLITLNLARSMLTDWQETRKSQSTENEKMTHTDTEKWRTPDLGWLKCNVDASSDLSGNFHGFGALLRDHAGNFIAATSNRFLGNHNSDFIEAFGVREALSWLKDKGIDKVIVEMDSQVLFHALTSNKENISTFGLLVNDCKHLIHDFLECKMSFVKRSANNVAHCLARAALSCADRSDWEDVPPTFIHNVLHDDI